MATAHPSGSRSVRTVRPRPYREAGPRRIVRPAAVPRSVARGYPSRRVPGPSGAPGSRAGPSDRRRHDHRRPGGIARRPAGGIAAGRRDRPARPDHLAATALRRRDPAARPAAADSARSARSAGRPTVAAPRPRTGAWPRPARSLPAPDLLGPDEELVAGRRPVEEVFAAGRTALRLLVVPQRRSALEQLVLHATRLRIPIVEVEGGSLTALAGFDGHQGVALVVEPRGSPRSTTILARAAERGEPPFVLVLDSLEDPQNVGTLLRSAEAAGVHGVDLPDTSPGAADARPQ